MAVLLAPHVGVDCVIQYLIQYLEREREYSSRAPSAVLSTAYDVFVMFVASCTCTEVFLIEFHRRSP